MPKRNFADPSGTGMYTLHYVNALMFSSLEPYVQGYGSTLRVCHALLKSAVLLGKTTKLLTFIRKLYVPEVAVKLQTMKV